MTNTSSFQLYGHPHPPLALLTDLYQITMAYGYWKLGKADQQAVLHLSFRNHPFNGGFTLAAGLGTAIDYLQNFAFTPDDLAYLATLRGHDEKPLFDPPFFDYLKKLRLTCDVDAIPEGTVVFPHEPLIRIKGSILQAQLLETALLNLINFPTLVATKAARICMATRGEPVLEFGLRRAQGMDGALTASRAAYIGGCDATSNLLAGKLLGIPVKGTHAHSWVMCFDSEPESFDAYADAMPNNALFLVDTYNTLEGVRHAIDAGKKLRDRGGGHQFLGIRLDSGDLAYLSIQARKMLDAAGFPDAAIVASNDLDEDIIRSLKEQHAAINVWGVGTKLATAYEQPALGGIYKLTAIQDVAGQWEHKIKLSEQLAKTSIPGILQVRRYFEHGEYRADMIYDELTPVPADPLIVDLTDDTRRKAPSQHATTEELLIPIFRAGKLIYDPPSLTTIRQRVQEQLTHFHPGIKRPINPHEYPVGLERTLFDLRRKMILETRGAPV